MKYRERKFLSYCRGKIKLIILFSAVSLLLSYLIWNLGNNQNEDYFIVEDGRIIAIDMSRVSDIPVSINVTGSMGETTVKKEVIFRRREEIQSPSVITLSESDIIASDINRFINDINKNETGIVELPLMLPEGVELKWDTKEESDNYILPLLFPPLIMLFLYRGEIDAANQKSKKEAELILRELPGFNNKLVLLMESGLIYDDALDRIATGKKEKGILTGLINEALNQAKNINGDTEKILSDYGREKRIPELTRIMTIISDSKNKGADLREKLRMEREGLWEKRKRQAEEQGKLVDTKLAMPLGMMLISLLLVTAAPAFMQF